MSVPIWERCLSALEGEFPSQQFNTWIRPLQAELSNHRLTLLAPNRFVLDWIVERFLVRIKEIVLEKSDNAIQDVRLEIGTLKKPAPQQLTADLFFAQTDASPTADIIADKPVLSLQPLKAPKARLVPSYVDKRVFHNNLNSAFTFENFVEGKSNQLAKAACLQVAENPANAYNPLFLYGGVGLGKTHLMHAIGNQILKKNHRAKILYLHSERFVGDMVKALQTNGMEEFKKYYRDVDALLIDDIQFFSGKDRTQEEFFHTFNFLLESQQQVILTSDRFPKEIHGVEERLKSRFGWGLTVAVEPPELETRVAILMNKATAMKIDLPYEVAFFIAKRVRSNVRELEGTLKRVLANSQFTGKKINLDFVKDVLRDLLALQDKLVTIENIQRTVADYYKIKTVDLLSKRRNRAVARPRQIAMALAKELTQHSLPAIGGAFNGRDHTTVMHACKMINDLRRLEAEVDDDYTNLLRILTS